MSEFDFQSADFYKFLIEKSPELISFHDPDGIFLYVSPSVTSILGYQPEELIGKNPYDYFSPLDKNRIFENSHQPILKGREIEHIEYQFLRKDGKYVWLQTITQSIRDNQETVIALFSTSREYLGLNAILDETEKKQVLDEIRLSEEKFFNAFYYSGVGMALVSLEGKWLEVNSSLLDIIGYSRDEILKLTFQDITHPDDLTADLNLLQETLEGKRDSYRMEKRYFHKNGSTIWILLIVSLVRDSQKKPLFFISQIQDITDRKNMLSALIEKNETLQALSNHLTERNSQLEEFNQIVSHNLRAPIGNIFTLTTMLCEKYGRDKDELLQSLEMSVKDLMTTLSDIVEVIKIRRNRNVDKQPILFKDAFNKIQNLLSTEINKMSVEIQTDFTAAPEILYSKVYLESILLNLLSNALKYSDPNRKSEISFVSYIKDKKIFLIVRDNGLGIDLRKYGHQIFKMNKTFHREKEGQGIGLFMTKNQIESLGGEITVESSPGKGTSFLINFDKYNDFEQR
ncbi:PAS domain-containing sensor histidine kinase [Leptospira mayottensis]|uniref:histidine kinase n=1 Tax=Leptospira mayottensis TaxID=1137606 RepID=A0ABM6YCA5_9LEPT|nr:PAS domain-containing sensor histidine kinase [Leptospira mayottensis]AXR62344.1 PAS domain S-box protein [Leptospira mayottensis]AXR66020.1 PAS domain S-box protein [Leptospira mayottensis]AZQ03909.1 histidine kinase [Leptospira mayottensis 200901116]TGN04059.1 PAS domain S-box protein [Leptospira mayottensis]